MDFIDLVPFLPQLRNYRSVQSIKQLSTKRMQKLQRRFSNAVVCHHGFQKKIIREVYIKILQIIILAYGYQDEDDHVSTFASRWSSRAPEFGKDRIRAIMWTFRTYQSEYKLMPACILYDRSIDTWNHRTHRQGLH